MLIALGWVIQDNDQINLNSRLGQVVREYLTEAGSGRIGQSGCQCVNW